MPREFHICLDIRGTLLNSTDRELGLRCIFTDVKKRSIVDLLAKRDKLTVSKWLTNLPQKATVEVVTMDM